MEKFKCCICGKEVVEWGNDPWPVNTDDSARCCDECNSLHVIPARLAQMFNKKEDK